MRREKWRENFSRYSIFGWKEGSKKGVGSRCLFPKPSKMFPFQNEEKTEEKTKTKLLDQNTTVHIQWLFSSFCLWFSTSSFFVYFLVILSVWFVCLFFELITTYLSIVWPKFKLPICGLKFSTLLAWS